MKALIVDDVAIMRVVMKDALARFCKFKKENVSEASNGQEALVKYQSEKPDIVFLDIAMPKMDGLEAVGELIKIDPKAKIVMCTSSGNESDVLACIKAGATDYITKPPQPKRIVQAVEKIFGPLDSGDSGNDGYEDFNDPVEAKPQETAEETQALKSKISQLEAELEALKKEKISSESTPENTPESTPENSPE